MHRGTLSVRVVRVVWHRRKVSVSSKGVVTRPDALWQAPPKVFNFARPATRYKFILFIQFSLEHFFLNNQECPKYQSVTSFADQVCREQHWMGMHRGVQTDRNCVVNCRDPYTNELTAAEGETGWFPSGTLCDRARSGYCLSGRCVVSFLIC